MTDTTVPDFFDHFPMRRVLSDALDGVLTDGSAALDLLFLWGRDCPNCDIAKRAILAQPQQMIWPGVRWLHDNVYEDAAMATRFGLHGIPAFFVFRQGKRLGRITSWPGTDAFHATINDLLGRSTQTEAIAAIDVRPK
ncbi:MAG: thioredoxin family protein [Rhodanobacteraceae bacterium]|nr:thioredoxin family protein [Rhodanobacteraceae bacterium]